MADSIVNLAALQRVDPYIKEIVESATQVALYKFSPENNEWDKTGVEGTLFVYKRSGPPVHGFIIMNRLSKTNQIEPITKELELQREDPYLLYRNSKPNIFGIWFYEKNDCSKISNITTMMLQDEKDKAVGGQPRLRRASDSDTALINRLMTDCAAPKNANILSILSKAEEAYSKSNSVPEDKGVSEPKSIVENPNASINLVRPKAVRAGGTPEAPPTQPHQPEKLCMETLFANASQDTASPGTSHAQATNNNLLHHLMSNPQNLVEHIERQQRSELPVNAVLAESLEKDLKEKLKLTMNAESASELLSSIQSPSAATSVKSHPIIVPTMLEKSMSANAVNSASPLVSALNPFTAPTFAALPQAPPMSLMSPMMFMKKPAPNAPPLLNLLQSTPPAPALVSTPANVLAPNLSSNTFDIATLSSMTKDQFTDVLIYLLKNDKELTSKLYNAFVNSLQ